MNDIAAALLLFAFFTLLSLYHNDSECMDSSAEVKQKIYYVTLEENNINILSVEENL